MALTSARPRGGWGGARPGSWGPGPRPPAALLGSEAGTPREQRLSHVVLKGPDSAAGGHLSEAHGPTLGTVLTHRKLESRGAGGPAQFPVLGSALAGSGARGALRGYLVFRVPPTWRRAGLSGLPGLWRSLTLSLLLGP